MYNVCFFGSFFDKLVWVNSDDPKKYVWSLTEFYVAEKWATC